MQKKEFEKYPKYRQAYVNAFQRMLDVRNRDGLPTFDPSQEYYWKDGESVLRWWVGDDMENWKRVSIKDVTSILGDGLHGTPVYSENGEYAFVNGNNLIDCKIVIKKDTKRVDQSQYEKYKKPLSVSVVINGTR